MLRPHPIAVLLPALLVVVLAAPATAQTPAVVGSDTSVEVASPEPIAPGGTGNVTVTVTYSWEDGAAAPTQPTQVQLNVSIAPPAVSELVAAELTPRTLSFSPGPQAGSSTGNATLSLSVAGEAPGALAFDATVEARAEQNGQIQSSNGSATVAATTEARYELVVTSEGSLGGGSDAVRFRVENRGNVPVRARVQDLMPPDGVTATPPDPIVLGPSAGTTAPPDAGPDWSRDPVGTLTIPLEGSGQGRLEVTVAYGPAGSDGSATVATATSGAQVEVGGLPWIPIAAGVAVAVLVVGVVAVRRRREEPRPAAPAIVPADADPVDAGYEGETWVEVAAEPDREEE